ncbi:CaiB/BaiF CoA transferase family protein [Pseudonocardia humida]|uniref:CoA transferase n=1 Tax=Pseudonocardia humida TaxID=2800819 RepID=A0ABT1A9S8_9PSEU|nr:CoA transferase [Pseudonocardia humida]MCO1659706.1 CoA transferase [Pseudonocardia humida]
MSELAGESEPRSEVTGPLAGVQVIDFTSAWAGPMTTRSLAFLGATVIKIESPVTMDSWRGSVHGAAPDRFPDLVPGERPYNRNSYFNTQNHDKLSVALNLKMPGAADVVYALAETSDVVIANFSPGVLDRLGLGYDRLSAINPRIITVEMPAFGSGGPMTHHVGMGMTMEAACGMTGLMGYGDGKPVPTGTAYMDPIGGLHGAAAVLTALVDRERTGVGQRIEVAQTEAAMHWIGDELIAAAEGGEPWQACGNRVRDAAPHDAYPCAGTDEWVAVAVFDDDQWRALCAEIGRNGLVDDPRFATSDARWQNQDDLADVIGAWTSGQDKSAVAQRLQRAGVPAAPVRNGADIWGCPGLREIGFLATLDHPEAGTHDYPGLAYRLERTPGAVRRAAPRFGEHNDHVLREVLGFSAERVEELRASGAVADRPAS